jgi:TetR/AcrR family transcriptional repressor of nem operon
VRFAKDVEIQLKRDNPNLRQSIVYESMRLFSQQGYLSTSIADILDATAASKGGFYNHFKSKEHLFFEVVREAQKIWRERVFFELDKINSPVQRLKKLLVNYRDRYLKDVDNFPGGCIFIMLSVELADQRTDLCQVVNQGFVGLKRLLGRLLDDAVQQGELDTHLNTSALTELLFASMIGISVSYGVDKSTKTLDGSIDALIAFIDSAKRQ